MAGRIFRTFSEAEEEIRRELAERSISVMPETMQDKVVGENEDYLTKEIQNFSYTVTQPNLADLHPTQPWADLEFAERVGRQRVNPGEAWKARADVWTEFLEADGRFSYTYPERIGDQLEEVIGELAEHPHSRQLYVAIFDGIIDPPRRGIRRVPCSLGYYFLWRQNRLDITYAMRSCDFAVHWSNDVYLARCIQEYVARESGLEPGFFTQIVYSLHIYNKDIEGVF